MHTDISCCLGVAIFSPELIWVLWNKRVNNIIQSTKYNNYNGTIIMKTHIRDTYIEGSVIKWSSCIVL